MLEDCGLRSKYIINFEDLVLVTGASGFIGRHVVGVLISMGFTNLRCLVRESSDISELQNIIGFLNGREGCKIVEGNLLVAEDCKRITEDIKVIYHLAAGTRTKSFSEAYLNSVVTTRNLIEASLKHGCLRRFVNVSSYAVYSNINKKTGRILDETCPVEQFPETRAEAYCYGKVKQDELVISYCREKNLPYVIVRPGSVYGPGKAFIPGRVGIDTFGPFFHLGGSNPLPLTYVQNCAEAIVLSGLVPGIEREVFNIVDDNLPTSRDFLQQYKKKVYPVRSICVPRLISFLFLIAWEYFARWSNGQIPPAFTKREWHAFWNMTFFSNRKIKNVLDWKPRKNTEEAIKEYFEYCRDAIKKE